MKLLRLRIFLLLQALLDVGHALVTESTSLSQHWHQLESDKFFLRKGMNNASNSSASTWTNARLRVGHAFMKNDGPTGPDYNEETHTEHLPLSVEATFALIYCMLIASAPLVLAGLAEEHLTRTHMLESLGLIFWLGGTLYLFTEVVEFQSSHWQGTRPLTLVEAVYVVSQILATVGYGDITPAFPRGMVWVGLNVIMGLCFYGSLVMEVCDIVHERLKKAMSAPPVVTSHNKPLKNWALVTHADKTAIIRSSIFFTCTATIGVLFWHFFPGEEKSWLQAVYMSIITLSTVGFGDFNATTEGGKVFAAFWMLIGVASLGAFVASVIEWVLRTKRAEGHKVTDDLAKYQRILETCCHDGKLDKIGFLKYGLMLTKDISEEEFQLIESRFHVLAAKSQDPSVAGRAVSRAVIMDEEGPPL